MNHKLALLGLITLPISHAAMAATDSGFISAANRADIAFDTAHKVLYISGDNSLRRYDMQNHSFLAPIVLGGTTLGMDISPDGKTLAVANGNAGATRNFVDLVNLDTGKSTRASFALASGEGGTYSVAYDGQGKLLVSSKFNGSGWVPLRKYDPATQSSLTLASVDQNSMLAAAANRSVIGIAEANNSSGPWGLYHTGDTTYAATHHLNWDTYEIGVSRDGSQVALPTYGGTFIDDAQNVLPAIGQYAGVAPTGVAYSPVADTLYLPFANTKLIGAYSTQTGLEIGQFDTPGTFNWTGNWAYEEGRTKVASDGSLLFSTLDNGVYYAALTPVPEPHSYALLLAGLGMMATIARRRAKRV